MVLLGLLVDAVRAVSPFVVGRACRQVPSLSFHSDFLEAELVVALVVDNGGICMAGFAGFAPRAVFLSVVVRARCSASWPV